jgi:hypothetical protein
VIPIIRHLRITLVESELDGEFVTAAPRIAWPVGVAFVKLHSGNTLNMLFTFNDNVNFSVALKLIPKSVTIFGVNSVLKSDPPSCWAPAGISDGLTKNAF